MGAAVRPKAELGARGRRAGAGPELLADIAANQALERTRPCEGHDGGPFAGGQSGRQPSVRAQHTVALAIAIDLLLYLCPMGVGTMGVGEIDRPSEEYDRDRETGPGAQHAQEISKSFLSF